MFYFPQKERAETMFRLWARTFSNNHMLQDTCIADGSNDTRTPFKFRFMRYLEQLVNSDTEKDRETGKQCNVRHTGSRLSFGHCLERYTKIFRQFFLLHVLLQP